MKDGLKIILLIFIVIGCSCQIKEAQSNEGIVPSEMQPEWTSIDTDHDTFKLGQILKFNLRNEKINAVILDLSKEGEIINIGICLIENGKLFGRQIPNGLINTTCLDLLDFIYVAPRELRDVEILESLKLDKLKIGIGSITYIRNLDELEMNYKLGLAQREKEKTPCNQEITQLNPVHERYFDLEKIEME